jgi:hypothetical protein
MGADRGQRSSWPATRRMTVLLWHRIRGIRGSCVGGLEQLPLMTSVESDDLRGICCDLAQPGDVGGAGCSYRLVRPWRRHRPRASDSVDRAYRASRQWRCSWSPTPRDLRAFPPLGRCTRHPEIRNSAKCDGSPDWRLATRARCNAQCLRRRPPPIATVIPFGLAVFFTPSMGGCRQPEARAANLSMTVARS